MVRPARPSVKRRLRAARPIRLAIALTGGPSVGPRSSTVSRRSRTVRTTARSLGPASATARTTSSGRPATPSGVIRSRIRIVAPGAAVRRRPGRQLDQQRSQVVGDQPALALRPAPLERRRGEHDRTGPLDLLGRAPRSPRPGSRRRRDGRSASGPRARRRGGRRAGDRPGSRPRARPTRRPAGGASVRNASASSCSPDMPAGSGAASTNRGRAAVPCPRPRATGRPVAAMAASRAPRRGGGPLGAGRVPGEHDPPALARLGSAGRDAQPRLLV